MKAQVIKRVSTSQIERTDRSHIYMNELQLFGTICVLAVFR